MSEQRTSSPGPNRHWDPLAALLLLLALLLATGRLTATEWTEHMRIAWPLTVLGLLSGLALGKSRFPPLLSVLFALAYGLFLLPRQLGLALEPDLLWGPRLAQLFARLTASILQVAQRQPVRDPTLFLFLMGALAWALSLQAGYALVRRGRAWRVILPSGLAILIIQTSDPYVRSHVWYVVLYLFFALLLVARLAYLRRRDEWEAARFHIPPLVGLDLGYAHLIVTALAIALAWVTPATVDTVPAVRTAWQKTLGSPEAPLREQLENVFASLQGKTAAVVVSDYYGEQLALGQGSELSDAPILTVQAPAPNVRHYWRVRVYDQYVDGEWTGAAYSMTRTLDPTAPFLPLPYLEGRRPITLTFVPANPIATLYVAPRPQWVNRTVEAHFAWNPDGTVDLAGLSITPYLDAGKSYRVRSSVVTATVAQLRGAGRAYPSWITRRYLQLPPTITPRTRELAQEIAAGQESPYDVADAITRYLRETVRYREVVPPPPTGQEPLDWFLFDGREGFCNYYASAEVVLLRSLGIPARLAVGFAEGEQQAGTDIYLVRQQDAHAWPEVYFPTVGWVEFEPTASQAPLRRPLGEERTGDGPSGSAGGGPGEREQLDDLLSMEEEETYGPPPASGGMDRFFSRLWILLVVGAIVAVVIWLARRRGDLGPLPVLLERRLKGVGLRPPAVLRRWARRTALSPMDRAYLEVDRALALLGAPPSPADTPAERVTTLTELLPEAAVPAGRLLVEYHASAYGPRGGNFLAARQAGRDVRWLAWRGKVRRLARRLLRRT